MATVILCDACGKQATAIDTIGFVRPGQYCKGCAKSVERFMADRDRIHTQIAKEWEVRLGELKGAWRVKHPEGRLPDE